MTALPPDNHAALAIYTLSKLGQAAARAAEMALAPQGLRPREFSSLSLIDQLEGPSQSDVADGLAVDRSDMVVIIDKLEAEGLVTRSADTNDRRRRIVSATAKGRTAIRKGTSALATADAEFVGRLNVSDQRSLRRLLKLIAEERG